MANRDYINGQFARLGQPGEKNPHYTLQLRGFDGTHTNWMNCSAEQLERIRQVLAGASPATPRQLD